MIKSTQPTEPFVLSNQPRDKGHFSLQCHLYKSGSGNIWRTKNEVTRGNSNRIHAHTIIISWGYCSVQEKCTMMCFTTSERPRDEFCGKPWKTPKQTGGGEQNKINERVNNTSNKKIPRAEKSCFSTFVCIRRTLYAAMISQSSVFEMMQCAN